MPGRINVRLPGPLFAEVQALAAALGVSLSDVARLSLQRSLPALRRSLNTGQRK